MNFPFNFNQNNPVFNMFGGFNQFKSNFDTFTQNFQNQFGEQGSNPQQMVQQLLDSGQMTQEQFNQFRAMANQMTGKNL